MAYIYLIGCNAIALLLPSLTDSSASIGHIWAMQILFIAVGLSGFKTFNK